MNINTPAAFALREQARLKAEGKLKCECGNNDWEQFLFISPDTESTTAGCKRCARCYRYEKVTWVLFATPPYLDKESGRSS